MSVGLIPPHSPSSFFAGFPMKLGAGIFGAATMFYYEKYRTGYLADKDAMFRHYVKMHPESFPAPGL